MASINEILKAKGIDTASLKDNVAAQTIIAAIEAAEQAEGKKGRKGKAEQPSDEGNNGLGELTALMGMLKGAVPEQAALAPEAPKLGKRLKRAEQAAAQANEVAQVAARGQEAVLSKLDAMSGAAAQAEQRLAGKLQEGLGSKLGRDEFAAYRGSAAMAADVGGAMLGIAKSKDEAAKKVMAEGLRECGRADHYGIVQSVEETLSSKYGSAAATAVGGVAVLGLADALLRGPDSFLGSAIQSLAGMVTETI